MATKFFPLKQCIKENKIKSEMVLPNPDRENTLSVFFVLKYICSDLYC